MLETFKYINHMGETLEFGTGSLFANENELRDFSWELTTKNDRISGFKKGIVSKTIPIIMKCKTAEEGAELKNRIFEVFEKDVLAMKHGKIVVGDYYLRCYVTDSTKSSYLINKGLLFLDITIQTDFPQWIKEATTIFRPNMSGEGENPFLDFTYDFNYDYMCGLSTNVLNNTNFVESDFRIVIYGGVVNPTLNIAEHEYSVAVAVETGEFLTIDSVNKTIVKTTRKGQQMNCFNNRNKESYIFKKIPAGIWKVTSSNKDPSFDITILEERSEPRWI